MGLRQSMWVFGAMLAGCVGGTRDEDVPPTAPMPWLGRAYVVDVALLGSDCDPGGLEAVALPAWAAVRQNADTVSWIQNADGNAGGQWGLAGRVCPKAAGGTADPSSWTLRLVGGRLARVSSNDDLICRVEMTAPAGAQRGGVPGCSDPAIEMAIDQCGVLSADFDVAVTFGDDCSRARACTLRLRWQATPVEIDPRTPLDRRLICSEGG